MRCDGSPDPTVLKQINTFINLKKETGKPDMNVILEEAKDIYEVSFSFNICQVFLLPHSCEYLPIPSN